MPAETLSPPRVLDHPGIYLRLDFSHDGQLLAAASAGGPNYDLSQGLVWALADGTVRCRSEDPYLGGLAFAPSGYRLAVSSRRHVKLWDAEAGQLARMLAVRPEFTPYSNDCSSYTDVCFSPSGKQLAVGVEDNSTGADVLLANVETGDVIQRMKKSKDGRSVVDVRFVRDGAWLAGLGYTYDDLDRLYVWDTGSGALLGTFSGHRYAVEVAFPSNGERLASTGERPGSLRRWRLCTNGSAVKWEADGPCEAAPVARSLRFSSDGSTLAAVGCAAPGPEGEIPPQGVCLWDAGTGRLRATLPSQVRYYCLDFSPGGALLATMSQDRGNYFNSDAPYYVLTLWDTRTGEAKAIAKTESRRTNLLYHHPERLRFSPDGRRLAVSHLKHVELWDLAALR